MNNNFLIPANTKRGNLIFGYFRPIDLGIFATGIVTTVLLMIIFSKAASNIFYTILMLLPLLISGLLVFPLPAHYHNGLVFLESMYRYYSETQIYYWRGWCSNVKPKK